MSREQIENNDTELEKIDVIGLIYELSKALKRFWWRVLLLVIICGGGFYFMAWRSYSPVYEASVSFVVKANQAYSNNYYDNVTAEQLGKTFPYIVTSGVLKDVIAEDLGIGGVPSEIRAEVMDNTNLFTIRVRDASPKRAYDVLQSVVKNYPQVAEYIIGATSLTIVDESGIPERPVNGQSFKRSGAIGVLVGAGISFLFLLLYVSRRKTIRQGEDLKKVTNARFLGNVPEVRVKKRSNRKNQNIDINNKNVSQNFKESIRLIRARIENGLKGKECPVLLVTSALPGEGKTTIAVNLALAFGKKNARVVLIDGDLRNPSVAGVMNLEDVQSGILQVLREKEDPENVFVKVPDMDLKVLPGIGSTGNPVGMIRSARMRELIKSLKRDADYIIIDTPPSAVLSDVAAYSGLADAAVMVVRQDFADASQIQKGIATISDSNIEIAGHILNYVQDGTMGYGYSSYARYGYGKYGYGGYKDYGSYGSSETENNE